MENKRLGALAGVVGALGLAAQVLPDIVVSRWINGGTQFPAWAPTFGTVGQTMVVYRYVTGTAGPLVTLALAVGLGYYVGTRLDLARDYRRVLGAVFVGSTVGVGVAWAAILLRYGNPAPTDAGDAFLLLAAFVQQFVTVALVAVVGTVAGAALGYFRARERGPRPRRSTEAGEPSPSERGDRPPRDTRRG